MEDYSNILWLLLIVGSAIVSFVTKRNEKKKEADQEEEQPENETTWQEILGIPRHEIPQPEAPQPSENPYEEAKHPLLVEKGTQRLSTPLDDGLSSRNTSTMTSDMASNIQSPRSDQSESTASFEYTEEQTKAQSEIMEGFELRKAVLWSEILKPKYNEDTL